MAVLRICGLSIGRRCRIIPQFVMAVLLICGLSIGLMVAAANSLAASEDPQPQTLQELQAYYPAVPDEANAALLYAKAHEALVISDTELMEKLPISGMAPAPDLRDKALAAETKDAIVQELTANANMLVLLHEAATKSQCRFPIDMTQGPSIILGHLSKMRDSSRMLELQALNAADDHDAELAAKAVISSFSVAQALRNEPVMASQLVRIACVKIGIDAFEQVVNRVRLSDESLKNIQEMLAKLDVREALKRSLRVELCIWMNEEPDTEDKKAAREAEMAEYHKNIKEWARANTIENERAAERYANGEANAAPPALIPEPPMPSPKQPRADVQQKQKTIESIQDAIDACDLPYFEIVKRTESIRPKALAQRNNAQVPMAEQGEYWRQLMAVYRLAGAAAAAEAGAAVERYRIKHGQLPRTLDDLAPDFLAEPVLDPFTEKNPVQYKKTEDGYVVYSIGDNLKDDGGSKEDRPPLDYSFRVIEPR